MKLMKLNITIKKEKKQASFLVLCSLNRTFVSEKKLQTT